MTEERLTNMLTKRLSSMWSVDKRIKLGRCNYGDTEFFVWQETDGVEVGSFCSFAKGVVVLGGGEHRVDYVTTFPFLVGFDIDGGIGQLAEKGITRIGNDVWIGYGATILAGANIGNGAVIGAGSVVSGEIPPYAIAVGNPARIVRHRFTYDQIEGLIKIGWWNWPLEKIHENVKYLCGANIDEFIEKFK